MGDDVRPGRQADKIEQGQGSQTVAGVGSPSGGDASTLDRLVEQAARVEPVSLGAARKPTEPPAKPLRAGNYRVGQLVGRGGMGAVYFAEHEHLSRRAIKILELPGRALRQSAEERQRMVEVMEVRFKKEARALDQLQHPNVVQIYDFGKLEDGRLYYVMELLEGRSLREVLGDEPLGEARGVSLSVEETLTYLEQVCAGLQAAHERKIFHRDLKPDNIFIRSTDPTSVKILDFGIAKLLQDTLQITAEGQFLGTLFYMSPEQFDSSEQVGSHNDIYALGVLLYRMLSGRLPYPLPPDASQRMILGVITTRPRIPLREAAPAIPAPLAQLVDQCMEHDPAKRPASVGELFRACAAAASQGATEAPAGEPHAGGGDLVGRKIGNFVLIRKLGEGGFGAVYLAKHQEVGHEAAIKVLNQAISGEMARRFVDEARAATRIKHDNIIDIYDLGRVEPEKWLYCVMELLEGREMTEVLREHFAKSGRMTPAELAPYVEQICSALQAAHDRGIVHRDLKPANIFVLKREPGAPVRIKLLDFGIAKLLERDALSGPQTQTGFLMGTPQYFAPEQAAGEVKAISPRTDIYSLGVILYQALSGRLPFTGESLMQIVNLHVSQAPPPLAELVPDLPHEIIELVNHCMAKAPTDRPESAGEVARRFAAAPTADVGEQQVHSPRESIAKPITGMGAITGPGTQEDEASLPPIQGGGARRYLPAFVVGAVILGALGFLVARWLGGAPDSKSVASPDSAPGTSQADRTLSAPDAAPTVDAEQTPQIDAKARPRITSRKPKKPTRLIKKPPVKAPPPPPPKPKTVDDDDDLPIR